MQRVELSIGFGRQLTGRVTVVALLGLLGVGASACLGFLLGMIIISLAAATSDGADEDGRTILAFAGTGLLPILFATFVGLMITWMVRLAAWLDGTLLTVRNLGSTTVDLAQADQVSLRPTQVRLARPVPGVAGDTVQQLVVVAGVTTVRLRLANRLRHPLPPPQLHALAGALSASERPGAAEVAAWLRDMAVRTAPVRQG